MLSNGWPPLLACRNNDSEALSPLALFAFFLGVTFIVVQALHSYWRLAHIPGPFLARFTNLWRFKAQNSKRWSERMIHLHEKYGRLVRIGPNHVSISDPDAIPIVYTTKSPWPKALSYRAAATFSHGKIVPSIIAMNEGQHTAVRKSCGRAFTTNNLLEYESFLDDSAAELLGVLESNSQLDLANWLQLFAMDALIRMAFSESLGFLRQGKDIDGILDAVVNRFDHWGSWAAVPALDRLFNKNVVASWLRRKQDSPLARVSLARLRARKLIMDKVERKDLLQKFLEGQAKYPELVSQAEIQGIVMSTIGAGADTTAGTLAYTFYLLCKHPESKARLFSEIHEARKADALSSPPRWIEVDRLPYLDAVLKESMRILPIASWGLDRVVPAEGAVIADKFIPPGTVVGCQIDSVHLDEGVYGADAKSFRPERWLEGDEEQQRRMRRSFLAFSAGKRICTGMHIAWLEIKKVFPLVMMKYEVCLTRRV